MLKDNQTITKDDLANYADMSPKGLIESIVSHRSGKSRSIISRLISKTSNCVNLNLRGVNFETLYVPSKTYSKKLYVCLSAGGRKDTNTKYQFWSWAKFLDGDMLCIDDPTYKKILKYQPGREMTGWYFGDQETSYLLLLADFLKDLRDQVGYSSVIFMGSSAGGYAGLYLANELEGTTAVVCVPQTIITKWNQYSWYPEIHHLEKCDKFGRFDIKRIIHNQKSKFLIIFNSKDKDDLIQIDNLLDGKGGGEEISRVGNVLILRGSVICPPTHHFLYDHKSFPVFCLLAELFSEYGGDDSRVQSLSKYLVQEMNMKYNLVLQDAVNLIRNLISEKLINNFIGDIKIQVKDDHISIFFGRYGRAYRYDICVADTLQQRCTIGFHVNNEALTDSLKAGLKNIADKWDFVTQEQTSIFLITKNVYKYEVAADMTFKFIKETSSSILSLIRGDVDDEKSGENLDEPKNRVYKVLKNGSEELVEKIPGVEIVFHGVNNTIKIHETFKANKLRLCVGDSCSLVIDEGANCTNSYIDINAKNINVKIGKRVAFYNAEIFAAGEPNLEISIGEETIFAIGVVIRVNDRHTIYDISSGKVLNKPKSGVKIGKHVWLGQEVFIMKDVEIPDGCIVRARSLVTSSSGFNENSVIAGVPARTIRTNVAWDIRTVNEFEKQHR